MSPISSLNDLLLQEQRTLCSHDGTLSRKCVKTPASPVAKENTQPPFQKHPEPQAYPPPSEPMSHPEPAEVCRPGLAGDFVIIPMLPELLSRPEEDL
jgi:hypothetical protein